MTDSASIEAAVNAGIEKFGKLNVLVNNAGYGAYGPLESFPMDHIRRQFDTNVIGLLEVTKAVLPHFRTNKGGVIVNISSIGGKVTFRSAHSITAQSLPLKGSQKRSATRWIPSA